MVSFITVNMQQQRERIWPSPVPPADPLQAAIAATESSGPLSWFTQSDTAELTRQQLQRERAMEREQQKQRLRALTRRSSNDDSPVETAADSDANAQTDDQSHGAEDVDVQLAIEQSAAQSPKQPQTQSQPRTVATSAHGVEMTVVSPMRATQTETPAQAPANSVVNSAVRDRLVSLKLDAPAPATADDKAKS